MDFKQLGSPSVKKHKADVCTRMKAPKQKIIYNGNAETNVKLAPQEQPKLLNILRWIFMTLKQ